MLGRRDFFKLITLGAAGLTLDPEKLLWVPGKKTFFLPSPKQVGMSYSAIVDMELQRMLPKIMGIFERDDIFYSMMIKNVDIVSHNPLIGPLKK